MGADPHRSDRVGRGVGPRIALGSIVGVLIGAALGVGAGMIFFEAGARGMWGSVVAGAVFGALLGAFWGGMTGLGPPAAEDDPLPRAGEERSEVV